MVLWPSDKRLEQPDAAGVTVMAGLSLKDWIQALPADVLDEQAIAAAWNRIEAHLARRDAADLVRDGPPPRSVVRYLTDLAQMPVGIVLGFFLAVSLFSWTGLPEYLPVAAAIGLASLMARGAGRVRLLATGFFLGSQAPILAVLVAIVVSETT